MRTGEGLHRFVDPVDGAVYLYTQFETYDAHRMYACFDQPDLKATFRLSVHAPAGWTVRQRRRRRGAAGRGRGRARGRFAQTPRVSTYITALVAGPYAHVHDEHDGIPLGPLLPRARWPSTSTPTSCSPSPSRASTSSTGSSATATRSASTTSCSSRSSTPARWRTPARSPSSRTTSSAARSPTRPTSGAPRRSCTRWRTCGSATSSPCAGGTTCGSTSRSRPTCRSSRRPRPPAGPAPGRRSPTPRRPGPTGRTSCPSHAPDRGRHPRHGRRAGQLRRHHLRQGRLGAQAARRLGRPGRVPRRRCAGTSPSTSTATPCSPTCSSSSRRPAAATCPAGPREWLETAGVNTLHPVVRDGAGRRVHRASRSLQEAPEQWPTLRPHRLAVGLYDLVDGALVRTGREELDVVGARTEVPALVGRRAARPGARQRRRPRPTPRSGSTSARSRRSSRTSATSTESLPRALCWAAAWDMTRDAEMPARDYVELVLRRHRLRDRHRRGPVAAAPGQSAAHPLRRPGLEPRRPRAAGRGRRGRPARRRAGSDLQLAWTRDARQPRRHPGAAGPAARAARRQRAGAGPRGRHRAALAPAAAPGRARRGRSRRDRRRARARPHRRRRAARRRGPGRPPDDRGQGGGVGASRRATTTLPNAVQTRRPRRVHAAPSRPSCSSRASSATSRRSTRCGARAPPRWRRTSSSGSTRACWCARPWSSAPTPTSPRTAPPPALRRLLLEGRDGVVRALRARERDAAAGRPA